MPDLRDALHQHLAKAGVAPFLFVGAGLSIRYLGLDGWAALLRRMAELTDYDYGSSCLASLTTEALSRWRGVKLSWCLLLTGGPPPSTCASA